jgi:serine protease Do
MGEQTRREFLKTVGSAAASMGTVSMLCGCGGTVRERVTGRGAQLASIERRVTAALKKAGPAIVRFCWGENDLPGIYSGVNSGIIISEDGYVITRGQHGLPAGRTVAFQLADGRRVSGEVLGSYWAWDIGLMRITEKGKWPHAELGKSAEMKPGEACIALGYPRLYTGRPGPVEFDRRPSPRLGRISTLAPACWFFTTCPLDGGDLGGGVFDLEGRLIGVNNDIRGIGSLYRPDRASVFHSGIEVFQKHRDDLAAGKQIDLLPGVELDETVVWSASAAKAKSQLASAVEKAKPATIRFAWGKTDRDRISGVIVSADGYIVTCAHHDRPAGEKGTILLPDGRTAAGKMLGSNPLCDVGLVKITEQGQWPHVELCKSTTMERDDSCILLGYPFLEYLQSDSDKQQRNRQPLVRSGVVVNTSSKPGMLVTSCICYPGDSGGGLFDSEGRLVGVQIGGEDAGRGPSWQVRIELVLKQWAFLVACEPLEVPVWDTPCEISEAFSPAVQGIRPITVEVMEKHKRRAFGTIVGADGWILTKASELYGDISCRFSNGRILPATVHKISREHDLAMLKVNTKNLPEAVWSERQECPIGTLVAAPGCEDNPMVGIVYRGTHPAEREAGLLSVGKFRDGKGGVEIYDDADLDEDTGLRQGDIITHVEGRATPDSKTFIAMTQKPDIGVPFVIAGDPIHIGVRRGDRTIELCFPLPLESSTYAGLQSHRRWAFPGVFETDVAIMPDMCGGPLVDTSGEVVGITIARAVREGGKVYVIPAVVARRIAKELLRTVPD